MTLYTVALIGEDLWECQETQWLWDIAYILSDVCKKYTHVYAEDKLSATCTGQAIIMNSSEEGKWVNPNGYNEVEPYDERMNDYIPFRCVKPLGIPRKEVIRILRETGWNISKSALMIGISRKQLYRWIKVYEIRRAS